MALKKYAYYLKGNKIAVVQMDTTDISAEDYGKYKSPTENVTDGIEIEYSYAPWYRINDESVSIPCESYDEDGTGLLKIIDAQSALPTSGTHIVIKGSDKFNGLHEISSFGSGAYLVLKTKYNGSATTESFSVYTDVLAMQDEDFEIDITRYQAQAITYYLKAKMAEEAMDVEGREYWMRLFSKQLEKGANSRKYGPRIVQGFGGLR
mgnify:CR=1 FL=1